MNEGATFGDRLKALRARAGKSQGEVASEINQRYGEHIRLTQTKLSLLEQRETLPRQEILEIFADYFHIPIGYFFSPIRKEQLDAARDYVQTRLDSEPARRYLEKLVKARIDDGPMWARTTEFRRQGDDIERDLADLPNNIPDQSERLGVSGHTGEVSNDVLDRLQDPPERPETWQPDYDEDEYLDT
jgi:transcriptional regulator with XRE-family HTH domain